MIEILFLMGFTLHNVEEAIWLPAWSGHAKRFRAGQRHEFRFAVIMVTALGYLLGFAHLAFGARYALCTTVFHGFVLMMMFNVVFPHLAATVVLRRYAPGLATGLLLNLPIGLFLLMQGVDTLRNFGHVALAAVVVAAVTLPMIKLCFRFGRRLPG